MAIDRFGFFDWAVRVDGPPDKVYSERNTGEEGLACHSIVGQEPEFHDGIPDRFLSRERLANGQYTPYAAASCQLINRYSGLAIQMYNRWGSTWTSGGRYANCSTWSMEAEGGLAPYDEPFTPAQNKTFVRWAREWEAAYGRKLVALSNMREHRHIATQYGYSATACASGRYAVAWEMVRAGAQPEDEEMAFTWDEVKQLVEDALAHQVPLLVSAIVKDGFTTPGGKQAKVDLADFVRSVEGAPNSGTLVVPVGTKLKGTLEVVDE